MLYPFPPNCSNGLCNYPAIQKGFLPALNVLKLNIFSCGKKVFQDRWTNNGAKIVTPLPKCPLQNS